MNRYSDERIGAGRLRVALYVLLLTVLAASVYQGVLHLGAS